MENLSRKLTKSSNKMLAGVCAGIAEYLGWDATLVRVIYLVLCCFCAAFPGVLLYILLCIVMPQPEA